MRTDRINQPYVLVGNMFKQHKNHQASAVEATLLSKLDIFFQVNRGLLVGKEESVKRRRNRREFILDKVRFWV